MATYTSNINLKKPAQSDKIRIADFNGNADNIDAAVGADFGQGTKPSINQAINSLADGLAIIANGNVHAAVSSGQFVYVRDHDTLAEGLYVATSNISANGTLSGSNLTANDSGGLNTLNSNIIPFKYSTKANISSCTLTVPSSSRRLLQVFFGNINSYWMGFIQGTGTGAIRVAEIYKGSSITVNAPTTGSTITFSVSSSTTIEVYDLCYNGDFMTIS